MLAELAALGITAGLATGGYAYAGMWPESQLFGRTLVAGNIPYEIALTFDDGPNDPNTFELLDVLQSYQVRATFFMIGSFVRQRPDIARAVRSAGHLVGNHTMAHPLLMLQSKQRVRQELQGCNSAIEDVLGERVSYFRPPHGSRRPDVLRAGIEMGLTPVMWNAMGYDWIDKKSSRDIAASLENGIRRNRRRGFGSNVLLHDGGHNSIVADRSRTVNAVSHLIPELLSSGNSFVTVDQWNLT